MTAHDRPATTPTLPSGDPMMEPCDLSAVEARSRIGSRTLSARDLLESCIARIEVVDHAVNAMVVRDFDGARHAALAADDMVARGNALGPLHGLPLGVKDLDDVAGLRTTFGSTLFRDNVAAVDCGIVAAVRAAGAIVVGKTNTPEFGAGANTRNAVFGATGNAFDPSRSAAGSSGGSAVALACGMVPLATGSDTGGSLRNPAAFNGVVGFRPSPGIVPNGRSTIGWSALPVLGPMGRTVADVQLLLSVMANGSQTDPLMVRLPAAPPIDLASIRAAITPDFGFAPTERHIEDVFHEKVGLFRHLFATTEDAHPDCSGTDAVFEVLRRVLFLAGHWHKVQDTPDQVGPNVHRDVADGLRYSALDVAQAEAHQMVLYRRWQDFFTRYDVIVSPAICISPRPWTELFPAEIDGKPTRSYFHWLALSYAVTVVGHPAVCLPVGRDRAGLPFGVQIVGRRGGDTEVLAVAAGLERALATDPRTARPAPDIATLTGTMAMADRPGFLGFG